MYSQRPHPPILSLRAYLGAYTVSASQQVPRQLAGSLLCGPFLFSVTAAQTRGTCSETARGQWEHPQMVPASRPASIWDPCSASRLQGQCYPFSLHCPICFPHHCCLDSNRSSSPGGSSLSALVVWWHLRSCLVHLGMLHFRTTQLPRG